MGQSNEPRIPETPDAEDVEQFHPEGVSIFPRSDQVFRAMQGEDYVDDVRVEDALVLGRPDEAKIFDPVGAPNARAPRVPLAFTVRPFGAEVLDVLTGERQEYVPFAQPDPLQSMEDADLRRANSFRAVPEPWDEDAIIGVDQ